MSSHPDSHRHNAEDAFDRWLDDLVAGDPREPAHTKTDDLRATATEFHAMAAASQQHIEHRTHREHTPRLEQTMHSTTAAKMPTPLPRATGRPTGSPSAEKGFWASFTNVAAVLLLIGSMAVIGYWATTTSFWPGGGSPEPTQQLAMQPLGTPEDEATDPELATDPEVLADIPPMDPEEFPQATDCTVEPLTIDEVVAIVEEPHAHAEGATPIDIAHDIDPEGAAPSEELLEEVAETHRTYIACASNDMYFETFAMMSPTALRAQILTWYPTFVAEEDLRSDLELLEAGEVVDRFENLVVGASPGITIDPDPENSMVQYVASGERIVAGVIEYNEDGEPWRQVTAHLESPVPFVYTWDRVSGEWRFEESVTFG